MSDHNWTCKIVLDYHRCPHCGKIIESRIDYEKVDSSFEKTLSCERCSKTFTERLDLPQVSAPIFKHSYIRFHG